MAILFLATPALAQVEITELMAVEDENNRDADGAPSDWLEITNHGPQTVSLEGFHLTNNRNDLTRWTFASANIAPGSALAVFASGKDRTVGRELHTSFTLDRGGDYLALVAPNGATIVSEIAPKYPEQFEKVSYGVAPAGNPQGLRFGYFKSPTPGWPNGNVSAPPPADVVFSETSRMFTPAFRLSLSCPTPGAVVRYTTDLRAPTQASPEYTTLIEIGVSRQVRARAFLPGALDGAVTTHTYLKMAGDVPAFSSDLPVIVVSTLGQGAPPETDSTTRKSAYMFFFEPDPLTGRTILTQSPALTTRAGVRKRGSSSGGWPKYSMSVETWRDGDDEDRNIEPLGMDREADWILSARYEWDLTLIRNPFVSKVSRQIGRYAPRSKFVEVFSDATGSEVVNLDYFGVYSLTERIEVDPNRVDITRLRPWENSVPEITGGYIFKNDRPDPGEPTLNVSGMGELTAVDPDGLELSSQQRSWITAHLNEMNAALTSRPSGINRNTGLHFSDYLDVDSWIDHHLLNTMVMNIDWGRHSAFFHKDRGGKVVSGPVWDYDRSLGCEDVRDDNPLAWDGVVNSVGTVSSHTWQDSRYPWYGYLLGPNANPSQAYFPDVRQRHTDRWFALRKREFALANLHAVIDAMADEIREAQARNFVRWTQHPPNGGNFAAPGVTGWEAEISHMKGWLAARVAWIDQQYLIPPAFNTVGGAVASGFPLVMGSPDARVYYTSDGSDPRAPGGGLSAAAVIFSGRSITETLVDKTSPCRYRVPSDGALALTWTDDPDSFDDALWMEGVGGVGFESSGGISALIDTDIGGEMSGVNASGYVRYPFEFQNAENITSLTLSVHCDDGFVAYLNGVEAGSLLRPEVLQWNSATADNQERPGLDATVLDTPVILDLTALRGHLRNGSNVLALHGLNATQEGTDFLVRPELTVTHVLTSEPLGIETTQTITARTFNGSVWSAPEKITLVVSDEIASSANLVVSEIMYRPAGPALDEMAAGYDDADLFEYLELLNIGEATVSLAGMQFASGLDFDFAELANSRLQPGERVLLVRNRAAFEHRYGTALAERILGEFANDTGLSNSGERLALLAVDGSTVRDFNYNDRAPWPLAADGDGNSLVLINPLLNPDHDRPANWRSSAAAGGTPGGTDALTFANWAAQFGNPAPYSDHDLDKRVALLEFGEGGDPTVAERADHAMRVRAEPTDGSVTVSFRRNLRADGLLVDFETSDDLRVWRPAGAEWIYLGEELLGDGTAMVSFRAMLGEGSNFIRQRVSMR
ncbi:MAG: CotH kinase family protein [Verrucomicrobiales bacterium]